MKSVCVCVVMVVVVVVGWGWGGGGGGRSRRSMAAAVLQPEAKHCYNQRIKKTYQRDDGRMVLSYIALLLSASPASPGVCRLMGHHVGGNVGQLSGQPLGEAQHRQLARLAHGTHRRIQLLPWGVGGWVGGGGLLARAGYWPGRQFSMRRVVGCVGGGWTENAGRNCAQVVDYSNSGGSGEPLSRPGAAPS